MQNNKKLEDILNHIQKQGFNRFVMSNNVNNEKILGFGLKYTTEPNINIFQMSPLTLEKYVHPKLCIELDRTQDIIMEKYLIDLATELDLRRQKQGLSFLSTDFPKYAWYNNILCIKYGDDIVVNVKCEIDKNITSQSFKIFDGNIFNIDYIDFEKSYETNEEICIVLNAYEFGQLTSENLWELKKLYAEWLNGCSFESHLFDKPIYRYNRSSSLCCFLDIDSDEVFIGLWDNYANKYVSKCKLYDNIDDTTRQIKRICDFYTYSKIESGFDLNVFGVMVENCEIFDRYS